MGRERYSIVANGYGLTERRIMLCGPNVSHDKASEIATAYVKSSGWDAAWVEPWWEGDENDRPTPPDRNAP